MNLTIDVRRRPALVGALAAALLAGCGAEIASPATGSGTAAAVTVSRCGESVEYRTPQNAVVYEGGSADKLFSLGLVDHVKGYVMPPANPPVSGSPWAADYARVEFLSDDLLNREVIVDAGADFVVAGWNSGFSTTRGVTPEILDTLGIQSFLHTESCFNYPGFPERVTPVQALYTDLERLGQIFGVQDRATALVAQLKERVAAVESAAPQGDPVPVFLYDSGRDKPFTAAAQVPPTDIIAAAGGVNVFADVDARWTEVTWEAVVDAQPEVVVILDYGDEPAEQKMQFLRTNPATRSLPAVKANDFFVLDYNEGISGPRIVDGMEKFGTYLRERAARG